MKRSLTAATTGVTDIRKLYFLLRTGLLIILCLGPDAELGGLYEPTLLPDFDPSIFGLNAAKLAQQDVLGIDGKLVAPWNMSETLRPGTLVAIEANLIVYSFCRPSDPSTVCITNLLLCIVVSDTDYPLDFPSPGPPCPGA